MQDPMLSHLWSLISALAQSSSASNRWGEQGGRSWRVDISPLSQSRDAGLSPINNLCQPGSWSDKVYKNAPYTQGWWACYATPAGVSQMPHLQTCSLLIPLRKKMARVQREPNKLCLPIVLMVRSLQLISLGCFWVNVGWVSLSLSLLKACCRQIGQSLFCSRQTQMALPCWDNSKWRSEIGCSNCMAACFLGSLLNLNRLGTYNTPEELLEAGHQLWPWCAFHPRKWSNQWSS